MGQWPWAAGADRSGRQSVPGFFFSGHLAVSRTAASTHADGRDFLTPGQLGLAVKKPWCSNQRLPSVSLSFGSRKSDRASSEYRGGTELKKPNLRAGHGGRRGGGCCGGGIRRTNGPEGTVRDPEVTKAISPPDGPCSWGPRSFKTGLGVAMPPKKGDVGDGEGRFSRYMLKAVRRATLLHSSILGQAR